MSIMCVSNLINDVKLYAYWSTRIESQLSKVWLFETKVLDVILLAFSLMFNVRIKREVILSHVSWNHEIL